MTPETAGHVRVEDRGRRRTALEVHFGEEEEENDDYEMTGSYVGTQLRESSSHRLGSLRRRVQNDATLSELSRDLLLVLGKGELDAIRELLGRVPPSDMRAILLVPSNDATLGLQTPLMRAASSGSFAAYMAVVNALESVFSDIDALHQRQADISTQLELQDSEGLTLAMHAARSGDVALLGAVIDEIIETEIQVALIATDHKRRSVLHHAACSGRAPVVDEVVNALRAMFGGRKLVADHLIAESASDKTLLMYAAKAGDQMVFKAVVKWCRRILLPSEVRELIRQRDADGLTFFMHAANSVGGVARSDDSSELGLDGEEEGKLGLGASDEQNLAFDRKKLMRMRTATTRDFIDYTNAATLGFDLRTSSKHLNETLGTTAAASGDRVDHAVPVVKAALAFLRESLWKEELHSFLKAKDSWGRTVVAHAVLSGRPQVYDAVFDALREEIRDAEVNELLELDEDNSKETAMKSALLTTTREMESSVGRRLAQLRKDVALLAKSSTIEAKIQAFIPGKLVVIFQLLLPEMHDGTDQALYLLLAICLVAPVLAWGLRLQLRDKPETKNSPEARRSLMSLALGAPAMFFWGIGTSDIGEESLGWSPTLSSTALAVATIIIPAMDSFSHSKTLETWFDKMTFKQNRFRRQANAEWLKLREQEEALELLAVDKRPGLRRDVQSSRRDAFDDTARPPEDKRLLEMADRVRAKSQADAGTQTLPDELDV